MKRWQLEIRPTAENDIRQRYRQIARESPANAIAWYKGIMQSVLSLETLPQRCPIAPEDKAFNVGIRHLVAGNYRVLFIARQDKVVILHVRHSAMDRTL